MKILHITPLPPEYTGGLPYFVKNLVVHLKKKKGVKCDILTIDLLRKKKKVDLINNSIKVFYNKKLLFIKRKILYPISLILFTLKKIIKDYDVIHVHGYHFLTSLQCVFLRKIMNFKLILHIHGGIQTSKHKSSSLFENLLLIFKEKLFDRTIGKFIIKSADKIISVSDEDLDIIKKNVNLKNEKCFYVPIGIDTEKFRKNEKIERKYITLLATRLTYVKGVDIFLKIIEKVHELKKNLKFLIVGDGPLKNDVLEAKKKYPIKFYKSYKYENIQDIYNMSKIVLITSRTEGVPSVLYESLACETPVISSNVGGIKKVIIPNKNGYLYDVKHYNKAVELILELLNDNAKLRELGRNGRDLILKNYSWEKITDIILKLYRFD